MRMLLAFVFAFISSCSGSSSVVNLEDEKEVSRVLTGRWETTHIETSYSRSEIPKEQRSIITYAADGSLENKLKDGIIATKGKWRYDSNTQHINESADGDSFEVRIVQLTGRELHLIGYTKINNQVVDSNITTLRKL